MLAVIDAAAKPESGTVKRLLRAVLRQGGVTSEYKNVFGTVILHISLEMEQNTKSRTLHRRLSAAKQILDGSGAREDGVCFTRKFPYGKFFDGYPAPDMTALYEALASQAVQKLPAAGGTAFFSAPRMNAFAAETLIALCRTRRFVLADAADTRLLRELQRQYGVSIIENPSPERISGADTAVFMGVRKTETLLSPNCVIYAVGNAALKGVRGSRRVAEVHAALPEGKFGTLPEDFPSEPLIADALSAMTVPYGAVVLRGVTVCELSLDKT